MNGITVSPTDSGKWRRTSDTPEQITIGGVVRALQWTFSPTSADVSLAAQETLTIDISKIKTAHPTGATKLYLRYNYVPEYQDGEFICAIEKAPLVFYDYKVGIGTTRPAERLHIKGGNLILESTNSAEETDAAIQSSRHLILRSDVDKSNDTDSVKFFHQDQTTPLMVLTADGKLGIGIPQPKAKLHIEGDGIAFESSNGTTSYMIIKDGNVGIGKKEPDAKLHVDGRIKDKTGYVMPVGSILPYAGSSSTVPEGWLLCDGNSFPQSTYPELYDVLGKKNTVPDLRNRFIVGVGNEYPLYQQGGEKEVTLDIKQMPKHRHTDNTFIYLLRCDENYTYYSPNDNTGDEPNLHEKGAIEEQGGSEPHNNIPPYLALNYIIKA